MFGKTRDKAYLVIRFFVVSQMRRALPSCVRVMPFGKWSAPAYTEAAFAPVPSFGSYIMILKKSEISS